MRGRGAATNGSGRPGGSPVDVLGALIVLLAWGTSLVTVWLVVRYELSWDQPLRSLVTATVYAPVAAVVLARRPGVGAILGSLAVGSAAVALAVVIVSAFADSPSAPAAHAVLRWGRTPEVAALALLPWLLVRRRGRVWRAGVVGGSVVVGCGLLSAALPQHGALTTGTFVAAVALFAAGAAALVAQWPSSTADERDALLWLGAGATLLLAGYVPAFVALPGLWATLGDAAFILAQGVLPTAVLAVVLGGHDVGASRLLASGTVWVQSLAVAVALFLVVHETARSLGLDRSLAGGLAAATLALAYGSVNRFVRRRTARLYFGATDTREVLARLGAHLTSDGDRPAGTLALADALRAGLRVDSVTIATPAGDGVTSGTPAGHALATALRSGGRTVGTLEVTSSRPNALRAMVAPVLTEICGLVAVATTLSRTNGELAETRQRMLAVRGEERRLLHRELRDGLAPALADVGRTLADARRLVASCSAEAGAAVTGVRHEVGRRTDDVRLLARSLLPAALDEGDLDGALHELALGLRSVGMDVVVRAGGGDVLRSAVQLAVYLTVAEALLGLRRPGTAHRTTVDVEVAEREVRVLIASDEPPGTRRDALVARVASRAREAGGHARTIDRTGGTVLEVVVPR